MKKALILILTMAVLSGCAGFRMNAWVGYQKFPPTPQAPMSSELMKFGWTDLISIITPEQITALFGSLIPADDIVGIGAGLEITIDK
jgi:hypothetical protein